MDQLPYLERVKIQSEILLPLYKLLRAEVGNERAAAMLRAAVSEFAHGIGAAVAQSVPGSSLDKLRSLMPMFTAGNALVVEPLADNNREFSVNIRACKYAEHFKAIGEPEFGAMMTCEIDPPMTAALGSDITLERSQTIMSGGSHCDFRWKASEPEQTR